MAAFALKGLETANQCQIRIPGPILTGIHVFNVEIAPKMAKLEKLQQFGEVAFNQLLNVALVTLVPCLEVKKMKLWCLFGCGKRGKITKNIPKRQIWG